LESKGLNSA